MSVGALPVAMIQSAFLALLMTAVGAASLILTGLVTALRAAIAMSAIAMRADVKDRVTMQPAARPLPEVCVLMCHRRHRCRRGGQRRSGYVSLGPVLFWLTSQRFCR